MAAVTPTRLEAFKNAHYEVWAWTPLANGDTGLPINLRDFNDITLKSYGTYGAGGEVTVLGSLNLPGTTTDADDDPLEEEAGVPLVLNAASPWGTSRNAPLTIWPSVTNGDANTALTVRAVIRR